MAAGENLLLNWLRNSAGLNEEVKHIVGTNPKRDSAMCSDSDLQQKFGNERKHSALMTSVFPKGTRYLKTSQSAWAYSGGKEVDKVYSIQLLSLNNSHRHWLQMGRRFIV